jgi:hypothetical protein
MKLSFHVTAFVFFSFFLFSCNLAGPSAPISYIPTSRPVIQPTLTSAPTKVLPPEPTASANAIPLEFENQKVSLEFIQNDSSVPCSNDKNLWKVSLKPEPFTLMVYGNKNIVSIMALKSIDMTVPLQKVSKPLITHGSTGSVFWESSLYLDDQPPEIYDLSSFLKYYSSKPTERTDVSEYLYNSLGTEPTALASARAQLTFDAGGEANYFINKIYNKTIGNYIQGGNSMVLVVFVERDLGKGFLQLKWFIFNLEFQ